MNSEYFGYKFTEKCRNNANPHENIFNKLLLNNRLQQHNLAGCNSIGSVNAEVICTAFKAADI